MAVHVRSSHFLCTITKQLLLEITPLPSLHHHSGTLPRDIREITGVNVDVFKRRLDFVLKYYPDEPRCSATGLYTDAHGRKSNSIYDLSKNREVKGRVNHLQELQTSGLPRWPGSSS